MRKHIFILSVFLSLFLAQNLRAQSYFWMQGASNLHGGTAQNDVWAANNNQAALAFQESTISTGVNYESAFLMKSLGYTSAAVSYALKGGTFGLSFSNFGYELFNTKKITLAYGKRMGEKLAFGVGLNYIHIFQGQEYGSRGIFTFDLSMAAKLSEKIQMGAHVFNPIRAQIEDYYEEKIPVLFNLGARYKLNENFSFMVDVMNDEVSQIRLVGSAEYRIMEMFHVRLGLQNDDNLLFNFGAGLKLGDLWIDFSSSMHQVLGYSPGFSLRYDINS